MFRTKREEMTRSDRLRKDYYGFTEEDVQTRGKKILESQTNNLEKASNSLANLSEDLDNTFEATNSQQIGM